MNCIGPLLPRKVNGSQITSLGDGALNSSNGRSVHGHSASDTDMNPTSLTLTFFCVHTKSAGTVCYGIVRNEICVLGIADLDEILSSGHLFANKFDPFVDSVVLNCIDDALFHSV
eukprot:Opistho-2@68332